MKTQHILITLAALVSVPLLAQQAGFTRVGLQTQDLSTPGY
jgi:hypothetical protein